MVDLKAKSHGAQGGLAATKAQANATLKAQTGKTWGRARDVDALSILVAFLIMAFCPIGVIYFWSAIAHFGGALAAPAMWLALDAPPTWAIPKAAAAAAQLPTTLLGRLLPVLPQYDANAMYIFAGWVLFQAALYLFVPCPIGYGQRTPAGHLLEYKVNGIHAWFITHVLYITLSAQFGLFSGSIIANHWGGLLIAANIYGYVLSLFSYIKAHVSPSHPEDRKFSGSAIYDMFWGIEFNPRIGKWFDFKLFHNGRPGIVAWTLISYSFAVKQYLTWGYVTNSMILVNFLHGMYVLDFFYNEDWYLRTIDICHDHFGFYLAWGDAVWLPFMYTLQGAYLATNPVQLSTPMAAAVFALGVSGYYIFRAVNHQKDLVRRTDGKCTIWGKTPTMIRPKYTTSDGKEHHSILLTSGFWGLARHCNYLGDLMISSAMCLACGFEHLTPYFYIVFMTILLVTRIYRDHHRCAGKYGRYWDEYCKVVPYKLIPYVW